MTEELPEEADVDEHPLIAARRDKLSSMIESGVDPYPVRFERSALAAEIHRDHTDLDPETRTGVSHTVAGRVMGMRRMGKLIFAPLRDESGTIQIFADEKTLGREAFDRFGDVDVGDWVGATGEVITTRKGELSIQPTEWSLLAKGLRPLPEKWHGLKDKERRYRERYVDLIVSDEARTIARTRSIVAASMRREFEARGFIEVETPVLLTEAGGALARPFETHHNSLGVDMYLRIATELHLKRLIVGGLERVFELGRIFRNEGMDATHNPEFTTLEAYQALADYHDIMDLLEGVFAAVTKAATGDSTITYQGRPVDMQPPYRRASMLALVSEALGMEVSMRTPEAELRAAAEARGVALADDVGTGKLIEGLFDELVVRGLWDPIFVMDHPKEISPLARTHRDDPDLAERVELYIAGNEYCDAFSELNDPDEQRARFEAQAAARAAGDEEAHLIDEDFIKALEYGMPPTGGLGIGIDRLTMLLTDENQIREVILFPALRPEDG